MAYIVKYRSATLEGLQLIEGFKKATELKDAFPPEENGHISYPVFYPGYISYDPRTCQGGFSVGLNTFRLLMEKGHVPQELQTAFGQADQKLDQKRNDILHWFLGMEPRNVTVPVPSVDATLSIQHYKP